MSSDYQFDLPVTPEQLEAIGMVAVEWSYLESVMDAAIWTLASVGSNEDGEAITTHLPVSTRENILATLHDLRLARSDASESARERDRQRFSQFRKRLESLKAKRNALVHSRWIRGDQGSPLIYSVQARGKLNRKRRGWPAVEIRSVAGEIAEQAHELSSLFGIETADE